MTRTIRTSIITGLVLLTASPVLASSVPFHRSDAYYRSHTYEYGYPYSNYAFAYPNYDYSYAWGKPSCSISVTNYNGNVGYDRSITLAWSSSYATSAYLSGVGSVGANGAQVVYYPYNAEYTLTVYGPGGASTCTASNANYATQLYPHAVYGYRYAAPTYATPTYVMPARFIQLSQTPYTGFDFGPIGNALYWLGILLIALSGSYLLLYYQGLQTRALARDVVRAGRSQISFVRSRMRGR